MAENVVKLEDVCEFYRGLTYSKKDETTFSNKVVLRANNINLNASTLNFEDLKYLKEDFNIPNDKKLQKDCIFICMSSGSKSHLGKVAYIDKNYDYAFGGFMGLIKPKQNILPRYLFYLLQTPKYKELINKLSNGININNIKFSDLKEFQFELPMLNEQERIINILDKADEIRQKKKLANDKLDEFLKSTFIDMFGDPVKNDMAWHSIKVGDFAGVTKLAGFEYTKYIHYQDSGDVIMIKGLNVKNRKLLLRDLSYIDSSVSDNLKRSQLHKDDIVMTYVGINIGDVALIDDKHKYHLAPNVAKISINDFGIVNPIFLVVLLDYSRIKFTSKATNTAKQALNMERIRNIDVILPPYDMQEKFAHIVEHVEVQKQKNELVIEQMNNLFNSLSQKVFKGKL